MLCNDVVIIMNTMLKKILIIEDNVLLLEVMSLHINKLRVRSVYFTKRK